MVSCNFSVYVSYSRFCVKVTRFFSTDIDGILNDFNKSIADYEESLAFEEEDFRNVEMRLDLINSLKNKYGRTIEDILDYLQLFDRTYF